MSGPLTFRDSGGRVLVATVALIGVDVVGGLLAGLAARNVRPPVGMIAAALLAVACLVSAVSGFFDGGLANESLSAGLVVWQVFLLSVTAVVGLIAAVRAKGLWRRG